MQITIIYHSGFGHTQRVAEHIARGAQKIIAQVCLLTSRQAMENLATLQASDALVFGSPTYFGNVSAEFKQFMEATGAIWAQQKWKDKLAAGFTNSSSTNGDKLNTLVNLQLFASQHSMLWIPLGILPQYNSEGKQLPEHNGMASYVGLMTMSDNNHQQFNDPADLRTAELFGERIARLTLQIKSQHEPVLQNN